MLPQDLFVAGLASFLVGHICYVAGFVALGQTPWFLVGIGIVIVGAIAVGRPVVSAVAAKRARSPAPGRRLHGGDLGDGHHRERHR